MSIKSSDEYFKHDVSSLIGEDIIIDNLLNKNNVSFKNCSFLFKQGGSIQLNYCKVENCRFFGLSSFDDLIENKNYLIINSPEVFNNNSISRIFKSINITNGDVKNLVDYSESSNLILSKLDVYDSIIKGSCNVLSISDFYFSKRTNKSYWNKAIFIKATCQNVTFDETKIHPFFLATKCSDKSTLDLTRATLTDDWSRLRKKYSGISLVIIFVLTFVFFLPIITEALVLILTAKIDSSVLPYKEVKLWKLLLYGGKEGFAAVTYSILTVMLLIYNIARFIMTISIDKLREEERFLKDSNFQLVSIHPEKYKFQLFFDNILKYLLWFSIIYAISKLYDTLQILVPVLN